MNLPITPCQNTKRINGAKVVIVPENTGKIIKSTAKYGGIQ